MNKETFHTPDVEPPVNNSGNKLLEMLRLGSSKVAYLADDATTPGALHTLD